MKHGTGNVLHSPTQENLHAMSDSKDNEQQSSRSIWDTIKSVGAAFLGVQSRKNWEEDVEKTSSPLRFILVGLVLGFVFFGALFLITYVIASFIV